MLGSWCFVVTEMILFLCVCVNRKIENKHLFLNVTLGPILMR